MKHLTSLLITAFCLLLASCENDLQDPTIHFIGDSIVANWDLDESFPSHIVKNDGVVNTGVAHLENFAGKMEGAYAVVLTGTNDCPNLSDDKIDEYADRYVAALKALRAHRCYVYSILPRNYSKFSPGLKETTIAVNNAIRTRLNGEANIIYIDVFDDFLYEGGLNMNLSLDGLHLNTYGYEILSSSLSWKL